MPRAICQYQRPDEPKLASSCSIVQAVWVSAGQMPSFIFAAVTAHAVEPLDWQGGDEGRTLCGGMTHRPSGLFWSLASLA
jgi:hypothetical protein